MGFLYIVILEETRIALSKHNLSPIARANKSWNKINNLILKLSVLLMYLYRSNCLYMYTFLKVWFHMFQTLWYNLYQQGYNNYTWTIAQSEHNISPIATVEGLATREWNICELQHILQNATILFDWPPSWKCRATQTDCQTWPSPKWHWVDVSFFKWFDHFLLRYRVSIEIMPRFSNGWEIM